MMIVFVAVDIGCLECGESSSVLGIYGTEEKARQICEEAKVAQAKNWNGQHAFLVFEANMPATENNDDERY